MPDDKLWMANNLNVNVPESYCYEDQEQNCKRYGRLYTWQVAHEECRQFGDAWRLPESSDWQRMVESYGESKNAYQALIVGGSSRFNLVFGGGREPDGGYKRKDAHGFYWTASEIDTNTAWFYNLGTGGEMVTRHEGEKDRALSVRCIRD